MTVFLSACEPHSWSELFNLDSTQTAMYAPGCDDNGFQFLGLNHPKRGSLAISGNHIFLKAHVASGGLYSATDEWIDQHFIEFYNTDGVLLTSFGCKRIAGQGLSDNNTTNFSITAYNSDGSSANVTPAGFNLIPVLGSGYPNAAVNKFFCLELHLNPSDNSLSTATLWLDSTKYLTVSNTKVTAVANRNLGSMKIGKSWTGTSNPNYYANMTWSFLVVTDFTDHTLMSVPMKPASLAADNQFFGTIAALTPIIQDKVYMSSSSEVGDVLSFNQAPYTCQYGNFYTNMILSKYTVIGAKIHAMGRYLQSGGTSVTFNISGFANGVQVIPDTDFVVQANQDDNYYQVKPVAKYNLDLTALGVTVAQFVTSNIKFKLKGV